MKNSADLGGCDNTLLDPQNSSYPTQPHSIIATVLEGRAGRNIISNKNEAKQVKSGKKFTFKTATNSRR